MVLIVSENPTNKQMEESLVALASLNDIQITSAHYLPGVFLSKFEKDIEEIIEKTYDKTRGR